MVDDAVVETAARALCRFFNLNPDLPITFEDRPGLMWQSFISEARTVLTAALTTVKDEPWGWAGWFNGALHPTIMQNTPGTDNAAEAARWMAHPDWRVQPLYVRRIESHINGGS